MSDEKIEVIEIHKHIAELNNMLHGVLNQIGLIRILLKKSDLTPSDINFDDSTMVAIEKALEKYRKR